MLKVYQILVSAHSLRLALAVSGVAALAACGQRGPLYLPTGEAAAGRATLPQILTPTSAQPASAPSTTGTATPAPRP
ncbi:MAG TPA: lipoprotein [Ramlibacter sp.]|nr:lipoprotein [Ramlibacter sp.]